MENKVRNSSFYPLKNLQNKRNCKEYYVIDRDGSTLRRIFLNIPIPELREKIICFQYLGRRIKFFTKEIVGFNIISRDNPWDFKIDLSTGEKFNIEITSIAENSGIFEMLKREERYDLNIHDEKVAIHELEKLNKFFPNENITSLCREFKKQNRSRKETVKNPLKGNQILTIGEIKPELPDMAELISTAIEKKKKKKHSEKESTVLIIDNRTFRYEVSDLQNAMEKLEDQINNCPFKEVWIYTGYYSSLDGSDAEFNLTPLKISEEQNEILVEMVKSNKLDESGILYT